MAVSSRRVRRQAADSSDTWCNTLMATGGARRQARGTVDLAHAASPDGHALAVPVDLDHTVTSTRRPRKQVWPIVEVRVVIRVRSLMSSS